MLRRYLFNERMKTPFLDENWQRAADLVQQYGQNSTSFQILLPGYRYFFLEDKACIAFVDTGRAYVAAGPVIGPKSFAKKTCAAFEAYAKIQHRQVTYFASVVDPKEEPNLKHLRVGQETLYQPKIWKEELEKNKSFQQQLRRARNKGVTVQQIIDRKCLENKKPIRIELEKVMLRWQQSKPMPPMSFLVQLAPFVCCQQRIYFCATQKCEDGTIKYLAFAVLSPIYAADGYLIEHLIRIPEAPNGCSELMIDTIQKRLSYVSLFSLGILPLSGVTDIYLRAVKYIANDLYHFEGLENFKKKLSPQKYQDIYISFPKSHTSLGALVDVAQAFTKSDAITFALGALFRGSVFWIKCMTWMLIPWTMALASVDTQRWFPSATIQNIWVGFDCILFLGLWSLAKTWRQSLARLLATLVTIDTVITFLEAWFFAYPKGLWGGCVRALAVGAPCFSAIVLWKSYFLKKKDPYRFLQEETVMLVGKKRWYSRWLHK